MIDDILKKEAVNIIDKSMQHISSIENIKNENIIDSGIIADEIVSEVMNNHDFDRDMVDEDMDLLIANTKLEYQIAMHQFDGDHNKAREVAIEMLDHMVTSVKNEIQREEYERSSQKIAIRNINKQYNLREEKMNIAPQKDLMRTNNLDNIIQQNNAKKSEYVNGMSVNAKRVHDEVNKLVKEWNMDSVGDGKRFGISASITIPLYGLLKKMAKGSMKRMSSKIKEKKGRTTFKYSSKVGGRAIVAAKHIQLKKANNNGDKKKIKELKEFIDTLEKSYNKMNNKSIHELSNAKNDNMKQTKAVSILNRQSRSGGWER